MKLNGCKLCEDVNGAQHVCTCLSQCDAERGCYYMNNWGDTPWEPPKVPVFKREDVGPNTQATVDAR